MPDITVEYMCGHKIDATRRAYFQPRLAELTDSYRQHYQFLRVLQPTFDDAKVKELEVKVQEHEAKVKEHEENMSHLQRQDAKREGVVEYLELNGKKKDKELYIPLLLP